MRTLARRVIALEARPARTGLDHLSDEELHARFFSLCEQAETWGAPIMPGWREAYAQQNYAGIVAHLKDQVCAD